MDTPSRRIALETLRDLLAVSLLDASSTALPALAREYRAVIRDLANLPEAKEVNPVDDIGAARAARRAKAQVSHRSAGG